MQYVIGSIVALATLALALGAITGRVKINSCCAPADPADDRRMRMDGYDEDSSSPQDPRAIEVSSVQPNTDGTRQARPSAHSTSHAASHSLTRADLARLAGPTSTRGARLSTRSRQIHPMVTP